MTLVLEVRNIAAAYGDVQALWDVSFAVEEAKMATLLGSNGAGKTTTLRVISGLLPALEGEVVLHGQRISGLSPHEIVDRGVIQVPEGRHLWPNMTVEDNLLLGAYSPRSRAERITSLRTVYELFPRLAERKNQKAGTMSGGEQQMCAMGRALMAHPNLLLLDEPSMGLAPIFVEKIFEIVVEINKQGTPILLVEQNALMALDVADRGYVLETGRIALADDAKALRANEQVRKTYLGEE